MSFSLARDFITLEIFRCVYTRVRAYLRACERTASELIVGLDSRLFTY